MPISKASSSAVAPGAKGDLVVGTTTNDSGILGVGSANQVLTVDSSTATGLKWATASSGGGMTLLASGSIAASATGIDISSISGDYNDLILYIVNWNFTGTGRMQLRFNNNSNADYSWIQMSYQGAAQTVGAGGATTIEIADSNSATNPMFAQVQIYDYANTTSYKHTTQLASFQDNRPAFGSGMTRDTSAINRITVITNSGSFDSGTYELFGVK